MSAAKAIPKMTGGKFGMRGAEVVECLKLRRSHRAA